MNNFSINTLYKFKQLPFESEFFCNTYRLIGRSGKYGAIDQLLEIYPNCVAGISVDGEEDGKLYLQIYIFYYRIREGKVNGDIVLNCFVVAGNHIYTSDDPSAIFLDEDNPELYFLNGTAPPLMTKADSVFLEEQRVLFNTHLEKNETSELDIAEFFLGIDVKVLDFIRLNTPINSDSLLKIKSIAAVH